MSSSTARAAPPGTAATMPLSDTRRIRTRRSSSVSGSAPRIWGGWREGPMNGILQTAANKLGSRQTLLPSASGPGPLRPILQVSGAHQHARHLNIVLAPVISDPSRGPIVHPCTAVLSWGAGGASTRAEVDFARGTELQLAAAFVSISGRNDAGVDDGTGHPIDT